jgi:hypothetical protein
MISNANSYVNNVAKRCFMLSLSPLRRDGHWTTDDEECNEDETTFGMEAVSERARERESAGDTSE